MIATEHGAKWSIRASANRASTSVRRFTPSTYCALLLALQFIESIDTIRNHLQKRRRELHQIRNAMVLVVDLMSNKMAANGKALTLFKKHEVKTAMHLIDF
ncbi:hypothetical protein BT63DRAFT_430555 [Microthyrium microscopicum]|uniref:Uncharacterized protein n=1 Tax=Microthyrium microscopicum TaxID=703497 RepID=A0A6A6TW65_9PEZI|nr:hypothetical protein BT63DRAFT_430555 [Microthyrium microscopicum]